MPVHYVIVFMVQFSLHVFDTTFILRILSACPHASGGNFCAGLVNFQTYMP